MAVVFFCSKCNNKAEFKSMKDVDKCSCGHIFGMTNDSRNYVNMRKTWSGQTKVEFNQTTMGEDIAQRNAGR